MYRIDCSLEGVCAILPYTQLGRSRLNRYGLLEEHAPTDHLMFGEIIKKLANICDENRTIVLFCPDLSSEQITVAISRLGQYYLSFAVDVPRIGVTSADVIYSENPQFKEGASILGLGFFICGVDGILVTRGHNEDSDRKINDAQAKWSITRPEFLKPSYKNPWLKSTALATLIKAKQDKSGFASCD